MSLLYTLGIRLYGCLLWIAQLFVPKARSWVAGRKHFWQRLPEVPHHRKIYWLHCASLGEFDQGLPLMNRMKEEDPDIYLLVTFFSPSGFEHYHKRKHAADLVCYLPLDTPSNARRFISHFRPEKVFFVKYEFWANYIDAAAKSGARVYSVSALFREEHRFFKWYGALFRDTLRKIDYFFVQNQLSLKLLYSIGIDRAMVCGDTRFDRVIENRKNVQPDEVLERFLDGKKALVVGSSWPDDESLLENLILEKSMEIPVIIAPHDIGGQHLQQIMKRFGNRIARYSEWNGEQGITILLIDSIGKLANAYSYGRMAFVGGGFSGSLHNILEPAVFGLPVIFGPKHTRFPEARVFIEAGIGFSVADEASLRETWEYILLNEEELSARTARMVVESTGATRRIMDYLATEKK